MFFGFHNVYCFLRWKKCNIFILYNITNIIFALEFRFYNRIAPYHMPSLNTTLTILWRGKIYVPAESVPVGRASWYWIMRHDRSDTVDFWGKVTQGHETCLASMLVSKGLHEVWRSQGHQAIENKHINSPKEEITLRGRENTKRQKDRQRESLTAPWAPELMPPSWKTFQIPIYQKL